MSQGEEKFACIGREERDRKGGGRESHASVSCVERIGLFSPTNSQPLKENLVLSSSEFMLRSPPPAPAAAPGRTAIGIGVPPTFAHGACMTQ